MAKDPKSPATTSAAYDAMAPLWRKLDVLLSGTDALRSAGEEFLPRHCEESQGAYRERLMAATLLNMLQFTLDSWTGKPFNKPVKIGEDVPQELLPIMQDIDLQGNNLDVFARNWFRDGLRAGFSHVLVEHPRIDPAPGGQARTLADDRKENIRPYLVHVRPENLIFAFGETVDGVDNLLQVRIRETETALVGFEERLVERIRVLTPGNVTIYEERRVRGKKPQWVPVETYSVALDYIPLVTFYADRQGFMLAKPPLADLADLNIRHFQSTSDQIAVLTVARFPILACSGGITDDKLVVGPNQWLNTPDPAGRFYYVEHTGAAIEAGRKDLLDLEEQMSQYGATFMRRRPGGASATARALDSAETTSPLQDMAVRFRDALTQAMWIMGDWMGLDDKSSTFEITTDFGLSDEGGAMLLALQEARALGDISRTRYTTELKRFGVLSGDFDVKKNDDELKAEPPPKVAAPAGVPPEKTPKPKAPTETA